eukprot:TRINITY_DN7788_c0_g1_i1.p1 TRINITY_DN7788_c0_g1~~TRINITY_DN7788_c0_g1_i1.p1  ORF type:complete len:433 (+),score=79.90 TRINITY_DN7788_c0_g1_i1:217-1515(+)
MKMKLNRSCALLVVLIGFAALVSAAPVPPVVIEQFYDPGFTWNITGLTFGAPIVSQFWYDGIDAMAWRGSLDFDLGDNLSRNITFLQTTKAFYTSNEICRVFPDSGNFSSFFSWLPYGTYNGLMTVNGRQCDEWVLEYGQGKVLKYCGLHSNNSIPVQFTFPAVSIVSTTPGNNSITWSDQIVPGPFPNASEVFATAQSCYTNGTACAPSSNGTVETLDFYVFHSPDDFNLANVNVADLEGDTYFVCNTLRSGGLFSYFQWLSWWQIQVNTSWGQYSYCNFGSCFGGSPSLVGREAAEGFGEYEGQCGDFPNNVVGSWFSLPTDGMCAPGKQVGDDGCSWQVVGRLKTINSTCLFSHGFANTCNSTFPLTAANKLFYQAFASDYPQDNGCPPLPGPEFATDHALANSLFQVESHVESAARLMEALATFASEL